jgi:hypothetical protein
MLEHDAGIFGCKVPIGFGVMAATVALPDGNLIDECLLSRMRRSRHCEDRTPRSDSAKSSELPCLGSFEALNRRHVRLDPLGQAAHLGETMKHTHPENHACRQRPPVD